MIRARGLGWRYAGRPAPALRDVELDLEEGACLVLAAGGSVLLANALRRAGVLEGFPA